jgi:ubiquinone/menaquinone biosynthesis C-methylase UbiE
MGHTYQVKMEIGMLKDAKLSADEFGWKVNVADEKRYDKVRKQYDSYFDVRQKAAMQKMIQTLADEVANSCARTDDVVLDVATGMGTFLLRLAEKAPEEAVLVGTDVDEKPLRGTMNRAKRADTWSKFTLLVTDAKHLCFRKEAFSTISSHFGFDNVPNTSLAFKEASRVLRPGGRIFFSSLWLKEGSESMRIAEQHSVSQIATEIRVKKVLENAGLTLERVEEFCSGVWPYNPMDLLPVEGEEYKHVVIQAVKKKE